MANNISSGLHNKAIEYRRRAREGDPGSVTGQLQGYAEQNSGDLFKCLAWFLEANGHWGDAGEKLYVHRHTQRYRMKRVEEITGRDLNQSQDRMEFWLALKAKELIDQARMGKTAV